MADPRAFISFDFDHDEDQKILFVGQCKNSSTPFSVQDWSSKTALPQDEWKKLIEDKINHSNMVIVLVGKYMKTATGIAAEIKMAQRNNVPIFGVYVGGADAFSNLPEGLPRHRTIKWTWSGISTMIDLVKKEGKNTKSIFW